jgi:hypothetical protein
MQLKVTEPSWMTSRVSTVTREDFIKKSYNLFHWSQKKRSPPPSLSLWYKSFLFLNEIMKNQVLNKIVCSKMESYLCIPQFFVRFFLTFPQTPAAHLRALRVTPVCRGTPVENSWCRDLR